MDENSNDVVKVLDELKNQILKSKEIHSINIEVMNGVTVIKPADGNIEPSHFETGQKSIVIRINGGSLAQEIESIKDIKGINFVLANAGIGELTGG